jgi:hypothetical protein
VGKLDPLVEESWRRLPCSPTAQPLTVLTLPSRDPDLWALGATGAMALADLIALVKPPGVVGRRAARGCRLQDA